MIWLPVEPSISRRKLGEHGRVFYVGSCAYVRIDDDDRIVALYYFPQKTTSFQRLAPGELAILNSDTMLRLEEIVPSAATFRTRDGTRMDLPPESWIRLRKARPMEGANFFASEITNPLSGISEFDQVHGQFSGYQFYTLSSGDDVWLDGEIVTMDSCEGELLLATRQNGEGIGIPARDWGRLQIATDEEAHDTAFFGRR
jgi:hypothetical protein